MTQQLLILGILLGGKMHGYRINEYVTHAMNLYTDLKKSKVYYTLDRLEKDSYVQYEIEKEGKRPERRVYQITDTGKSYFIELLRTHLGDFTRTYYVDDIGVAFMDQLSNTVVYQLLIKKREKIEATLKQFRDVPDHGANWRYVIKHNITHLEADLAWVDGILSELSNVKT